MLRLFYVYLVVVLSLPSWLGAVITDTIILEKEMQDGSHQRVVFWGDYHLFDKKGDEHVDAINKVLENIKRSLNTGDQVRGNVFNICDKDNVCSTYVPPVTILLENRKREYKDFSDTDWELHRCLVSLLCELNFSKDDRDGLLSAFNKGYHTCEVPLLTLDKNKEGGEEKEQLTVTYGSVLESLQALSEGTDKNPSLVIKPIDTRRNTHVFFQVMIGAWIGRAMSIHDKPAPKIFSTCASMSLTLIDIVDEAIEDLKKGIQQSNLLFAHIHSSSSQEEIDEYIVKTSKVIDWLSTLRNLLNEFPIFSKSTLFQLGYAIKDRVDMIPKEVRATLVSFREMFFAIFPECGVMKDSIGRLLNKTDLLDSVNILTNPDNNIFRRSGLLQLDAEIIHRILSSNDSQLIFVAAGSSHAIHCAWLLENEGYKVLYATRPPAFLEELFRSENPWQHPVDESTFNYVFNSRLVLQERYIKRLVQESYIDKLYAAEKAQFSNVKDAIVSGRKKVFDHFTPSQAAELYERLKVFLDKEDRNLQEILKELQGAQTGHRVVGTVLSLGALFAIYRFAQNPRFLSCKGIGTFVLTIVAGIVDLVAYKAHVIYPSLKERNALDMRFNEWIRNQLKKQAAVNE